MPSAAALDLRLINQRLRCLLIRLENNGDFGVATTMRNLSELMAALSQPACSETTHSNDAELKREISAYRANISGLERILFKVEARLLLEKARLEVERTHIAAAAAWVQTSRGTV